MHRREEGGTPLKLEAWAIRDLRDLGLIQPKEPIQPSGPSHPNGLIQPKIASEAGANFYRRAAEPTVSATAYRRRCREKAAVAV